jgi:hypothetical protein
MARPRSLDHRLGWVVLALFISTLACSVPVGQTVYEGDDFTFSVPAWYKTNTYDPPYIDPGSGSEELLFTNVGHYPYFQINRQMIPAGSDLDAVFAEYLVYISERYSTHFQVISQNTISIYDRTGIEYVHREFIGEPYVQTREIWVECNGWAYSLICVSPADATPGAVIPVSDQCIRIAEGFHFK